MITLAYLYAVGRQDPNPHRERGSKVAAPFFTTAHPHGDHCDDHGPVQLA